MIPSQSATSSPCNKSVSDKRRDKLPAPVMQRHLQQLVRDKSSRRPRPELHLHIPHSNITKADHYIEAMQRDQARMFCTELDNRVHVHRVPDVYVDLMIPAPRGQARAGVVYHEMEVWDDHEACTQTWSEWFAGIGADIEAFCRRWLARRRDRDEVGFLP
ncbi:MAG: hypothetical protein ACRYGR_05130 [Janthinobacterium lividum]